MLYRSLRGSASRINNPSVVLLLFYVVGCFSPVGMSCFHTGWWRAKWTNPLVGWKPVQESGCTRGSLITPPSLHSLAPQPRFPSSAVWMPEINSVIVFSVVPDGCYILQACQVMLLGSGVFRNWDQSTVKLLYV